MEHQEDAKINMPTDTPIDLRPPTPTPHPPLPTDPIDSDLLRPRVSVDIPSARTSGEANRASGSPQGTATNSSTSNQSPPHKHSPLPIPKPRLPSTRLFHSQTSPLSPRPRRRSLDGASSLPSLGRLDENPSSWILLRKSQLTGGGGRGGKRRDTASDSNIQQRESLDGEDSSAASIGHKTESPLRSSRSNSRQGRKESGKEPQADSRQSRPRRAISPFRFIHQFSEGLHRHPPRFQFPEEPFVPVDPFKFRGHFAFPFHIRRHKVEEPSQGLPSHHTVTSADYDFNCSWFPFTFSSSRPVIPNLNATSHPHPAFTPLQSTRTFLLDTLPRQLYINLLLRLPAMYFSRVAKIFQDAEVSKPDIQRMIEANGNGNGNVSYLIPTPEEAAAAGVYAQPGNTMRDGPGGHGQLGRMQTPTPPPPPFGLPGPPAAAGVPPLPGQVPFPSPFGTPGPVQYPPQPPAIQITPDPSAPLPSPDEWTPPYVSPALIRFKHSWEAFIDSLMREWKTLNVVSALLLSAILTMFQVPDASSDPITRTAALLSLVCATMSLCYGCMYILRFGTMRSMIRASRWAEEAAKNKTSIWWNVWVFLAMPVVWIAWSMIFFVFSLLSYIWRTGSSSDPPQRNPLSPSGALVARIMITLVFGLGMIYFVLIVVTLRRYGQSTQGRGMRSKILDEEGGGQETGGAERVGENGGIPAVSGLPPITNQGGALLSVDTSAAAGPSLAPGTYGQAPPSRRSEVPAGADPTEYAAAMERRGRGREPRYAVAPGYDNMYGHRGRPEEKVDSPASSNWTGSLPIATDRDGGRFVFNPYAPPHQSHHHYDFSSYPGAHAHAQTYTHPHGRGGWNIKDSHWLRHVHSHGYGHQASDSGAGASTHTFVGGGDSEKEKGEAPLEKLIKF